MDAFDSLFLDGQQNQPGHEIDFYWNFAANPTAEPSMPAAPADNADYTTMTGVYTCAEGSEFGKIRCIIETSDYENEYVGGVDGRQHKYIFKARLSGYGDDMGAFIAKGQNSNLILGISPINQDFAFIFGNKAVPAKLTEIKAAAGKVGGSVGPGIDITIVAYGNSAFPPKFDGTIPVLS